MDPLKVASSCIGSGEKEEMEKLSSEITNLDSDPNIQKLYRDIYDCDDKQRDIDEVKELRTKVCSLWRGIEAGKTLECHSACDLCPQCPQRTVSLSVLATESIKCLFLD